MKRLISIIASGIILAAIYFILLRSFPVYAYLLPFILTLLILDVFLWYSISKGMKSLQIRKKRIIFWFFWSPLVLLIFFIIAGFFFSFITWNIVLRTYLMAIILIIYVCKIFPIFFLLIADLFRMIQSGYHVIFNKQGNEFILKQRSKGLLLTGWITGSVFFLMLLYGMIIGIYNFTTKEVKIRIPELPSSFEGIRIVQISDLHLGSWTCKEKLRESVDKINSLNPDMVFFTGDLVNYSSYESYEFANILVKIKAKLGIFSILGNHDYGDYVTWPSREAKKKNLDYLFEIYKYMGWKLLLNENVLIRRGNDSIAIIGVQNWGLSKRFQRLGNLDAAVKGVSKVAVQLLLTHDPSHWNYIVKKNFKNIDVTFSGHTHGFQFGIDCCGIFWSPAQYLYQQWGGLYSSPVAGSHPQYLYVNTGLGSIGYPGRIGISPEITLFVLRKE